MSNEIQTRPSQAPATLDQLVRSSTYTARFNEVLKDRAPQFMASILSVGRTMVDVEPKSIVAAAMQAAVLNLPIEKSFGFAWLVPYRDGDKKYCQFQMGHKGFIQLALRTGQYVRMNARAINKEALLGVDDVGEPIIDWNNIDPDKEAAHYVFAFKLANGFSKVACWSKARVQAHASRYSQSYKSGYNSPWKTNFDEMALKTVVKNELSDWGILSVDVASAMRADQAVMRSPEDEPEFLDVPAEPAQIVEPPQAAQAAKAPKPAKVTPAQAAPATQVAPAMAAITADPDPFAPENEPEPETGEPREGGAAPTEPATQLSIQGELKQFCVDQNFGILVFLKWAVNAQWIPADHTIQDWEQVPLTVAVRCLRSKSGLERGLKGVQL